MNIVLIICQVLLCILALVVVVAVLMQKPRDSASGAAFGQGGPGGSYADRMKSHSLEGRLDTITKYGSIAVLVISFGLVLLQRFAA